MEAEGTTVESVEISDLERLIGRALLDVEFREVLLRYPKYAAASLDIELTPYQIEKVQGLDKERLEKIAADFIAAADLDLSGLRATW